MKSRTWRKIEGGEAHLVEPPLPPSRACGSSTHGSPVDRFTSERIDCTKRWAATNENSKPDATALPAATVFSSFVQTYST